MKGNTYEAVRLVLNEYLEKNNCRKTPERFAILKAIYTFKSFFSLQDIIDRMDQDKFHVSRGTLYNTLKLFIKLKFVVVHHLDCGVRYEASHAGSRCVRICTSCGKATLVDAPDIIRAIENTHFSRFRKEGFSVFVYGLCSSCSAIRTRLSKKETKK